MSQPNSSQDEFSRQAAQRKRSGIVREFFDFLKENRKWWLAPIILAVLGLGVLVLLGGGAAAPFIYTLF